MAGKITPRAITEDEAAEYIGLSSRSLQKRRTDKKGPAYIKVGRSVRYLVEDLDAFLQSNKIDHGGE